MPRPRFRKGNSGRPKGSQNRVTRAFKEAVLVAFEGIGGTDALTVWARAHPGDFYRIAARLIPTETQVSGELRMPISVTDKHYPE